MTITTMTITITITNVVLLLSLSLLSLSLFYVAEMCSQLLSSRSMSLLSALRTFHGLFVIIEMVSVVSWLHSTVLRAQNSILLQFLT